MKKKMMFFGFLMTLATAFTFFEMPELLSTHISSQETNIALANVGANCLSSTYLTKQVQTGVSRSMN